VSRSAAASKGSFNSVTELGFKGSQAGVEQFAFRDDDDVEAWRELVATKNLSNQSFSSISLDRATQFLRSGDSQSANRQVVREREHRQITAVRPDTTIVDLLVLDAATNAFVPAETSHKVRLKPDAMYSDATYDWLLPRANCKTLAPLGATPLQHQAAIFCAHPDEKAMGFVSVTGIRLKRALALHECSRGSGCRLRVMRFGAQASQTLQLIT
jgi:hypothetical protein